MTFITKNFLLQNQIAKRLYHEVAKDLPLIDPHNHLDTESLAKNEKFENLYQLWVKPDQYKKRAMRNCGIPEQLITGNAPDFEKFKAWASCVKKTVLNPLFHWSCMELKELFNINEILTAENAQEIYDKANEYLHAEEYRSLNLVKRWKAEVLCTSDDLNDSLKHHFELQKEEKELKCLPSLRGDSIIGFDQPGYHEWFQTFRSLVKNGINNLADYKKAIAERLDFFEKAGCVLSDHSFDSGFQYLYTGEKQATEIFGKVLAREKISSVESVKLKSHLVHFLGTEYSQRNWKMQLHIGAERFTNTKIRKIAGPAGGFACLGNSVDVKSITRLLDDLDKIHQLPKVILYTLNPADNEVFASITGSYAQDNVPGKVQFGPAWWFNDHRDGITEHLKILGNYGLFSLFIGMTTDSRSILSLLRHDYFRRILCNQVGRWVEKEQLPNDWELLSELVANISYYNIKKWIY